MSQNEYANIITEAKTAIDKLYRSVYERSRSEFQPLLDSLNKAQTMNPNNSEPYYLLGNLFYFNYWGDSVALDYFQKALNLDPNNIKIWKRIAFCYKDFVSKGKKCPNFEEAAKWFERVIAQDPKDEESWDYLLACLKNIDEKGISDRRKAAIQKVASQFPNSPWAMRKLGDFYMDILEYRAAIEYYQKFLKSNPDTAKYTKFNPDNTAVLSTIAIAYERIRDFQNAVQCLEKTYERNVSESDLKEIKSKLLDLYPRLMPGLNCTNHPIRKEFLSKFKEKVQDNMSNIDFWYNQNCFDNVIEKLTPYTEFFPEDIKAQGILALAYFSSSLNQEGMRIVERYKENEPSEINALIARAHSYTLNHDFQKALALYQKILVLDPENVRARVWMAIDYMQMNEGQKARELCLQCLQIKLQDEALLKIGNILHTLKDYQQAIEIYASYLCRNHYKLEAYYPLIQIFTNLGNLEFVKSYIKVAILENPKDPDLKEIKSRYEAIFKKELNIDAFMKNPKLD
nr:tetratricopeptide repeat protein [Candidatus Sigynarchaeota archaeon]